MTPAGMERNVEGRISLADRGDYLVGAGFEPIQMNREMLKAAFKAVLEDLVGSRAHRRSGQEASSGLGF
jgi:hypothetical protein